MLQEISVKNKNDFQKLQAGINKYHSCSVDKVQPSSSAQITPFAKSGIPILIIPSLINRATILNLTEQNSFCKELAEAGFAPYLVDWGNPCDFAKTQDIMGYMKNILLPLLKTLPPKFLVLGYCMGGFMGLLLEKLCPARVMGYITLATPWDFSANKLKFIKQPVKEISGEQIKLMFYFSAPFDINQKFISFAKGKFNEQEFVEIEHWVNDTPDLATPVYDECIEQFYGNNALYNGSWHGLDARAIDKPSLVILGKKDNITSYLSGLALHQQLANSTLFSIESGHIGLILNKKKITVDAIKTWCACSLPDTPSRRTSFKISSV
ncbi:MAG: hypothetical protein ACHP6I_02000 [Rickettsiales bacterium]